jgi:subtilisin-like proprotein convertase family protein
MNRNIALTAIITLTVVLGLLFFSTSLAERANNSNERRSTTQPTATSSKRLKTNRTQSPRSAPISGEAVYFAKSRPVTELAAEQITLKDTSRVLVKDHEEVVERARERKTEGKEGREREDEEEEEEEREKNPTNTEKVRQIDLNARVTGESALARMPSTSGGIRPEVMPGPSVSFEGISLTDTTALPGQGFLPPDTVGEIGPNHFVQMVNSAFRVYSRTGTPLIPLTSIGALFGTIPGPCAGSIDGDPIVMYDQMADRWLLSEFCTVGNPNTHQLIAISQTSDPTGAYFLYDFMMPNNKFNDYPKFGVWPDAYYMTDNQFNQAGTQFLGAGVFAFDRAKMIAGDPTASFVYFDLDDGCPGGCEFGGMLPADLDGVTPPPTGTPAPIMQVEADEFGASSDSLRIFDFHADFATPANSTLTERTGSPLTVASFDPREVPFGSQNVIPQPPPGVAVDPITDRLMFRLAYRNFGTHESLVLNHSVNVAVNPIFRAGVRYYEIRKTSPANAWTVHEQATMAGGAGDTVHRWMGSVALNGAGSLAVGYSVSSATVFPSIRFAGRVANDPPGSLGQGEATLVDGTSSQTHASGRWGDYSDLTVDPVDDCTFWYTQQYVTGAAAPDNTRWHTRVGAFQFGTCAPIPKGILTGTVTSSATGAVIQNAQIVAGSFFRRSNASGVYSIDPIATGTYTVTVSAPGYLPANIPNVTIAQGATNTLNVQLVPQTILNAGSSSLLAESCSPANNTLDSGETVTVNFPITNVGGSGATTTNLVATLQATGGVGSPSGPQSYGTVTEGSPAVTRPFTFTVTATCGQVVTATLHLMDGSTDYGNITYTFQTGTPSPAISSGINTTGSLSVAIPDLGTVDVPIVISDVGSITDVNVSVRLNHTFDGDLVISLISPEGLTVPLSGNRGGNGDNFGVGTNDCSGTSTTFDDSAATSISVGTAPFTGSFRPETPLSVLNGRNTEGTWILRVVDTASGDTGNIGCVTLEIKRRRYLCCGVAGAPAIEKNGNPSITFEGYNPPNGTPDPGEGITAVFPMINTGDGNGSNIVATLQNSGGITPVAPAAQSYGALSIGGSGAQAFTFVANGSCGTNVTATLHLQDGALDLGNLTYTFRLGTINTASQTFSNTTPITIPGTGTGTSTGAPANPYPSDIVVSGAPTTISKVVLTLNDFNHDFTDDVDLLLVSPTGRKMIVMSDAGFDTVAVDLDMTIDDDAAALLPDDLTLTTGSFRPANYFTVQDPFPAPAPASPYLTPVTGGADTLTSAFTGVVGGNPNGTWSLYAVDDAGVDVGSIDGGWSLTLITTSNVCLSPSAAPGVISGRITTADGTPVGGVTMKLEGPSTAITFTNSFGNYQFENIDIDRFYTVTPTLANYQFTPANRSFSLLGNVTNAVFTAVADPVATANAIDTNEYFVRQHYLDFLGREPDQGGFNYWSDQLNRCGNDAQCRQNRRVDISAAFFIEQEFQRTGSFIFQFYKGALGRRLTYSEFAGDRELIVDGSDLEARKEAFAEAFVNRPEFVQKYQLNTTADSFVDALLENVLTVSGIDLRGERSRLIEKYNSASSVSKARSLVVKDVAENGDFAQASYNQAFVLIEYFGYLKRDPEQGGYDFWLDVLNNREAGNYRGMVCAFITSAEYQRRFGTLITRSNADCAR